MITGVIETFAICRLYHIGHFLRKVVARLTEHDDVIKHSSEGPGVYILLWAPHLLGPALCTVAGKIAYFLNILSKSQHSILPLHLAADLVKLQ